MKDGQAAFVEIISALEPALRECLEHLPEQLTKKAQEIRLISGFPPQLRVNNRSITLDFPPVKTEQIGACLVSLCGGSVHSHQRELSEGYLTLPGGHRAGFAATAVYDSSGALIGFRDTSAIVLRIARAFNGISLPLIRSAFSGGICGLIIAGAPSSGKTTMLKDMARQLTLNGESGCERAVVVDERGELGSCGGAMRLCGYKKAQGILLAVKNLSPRIIFCDEIGDGEEALAVAQALNSGVNVITTVHAASRRELISRPAAQALLKSGAFERFAILDEHPAPCTIKEVGYCHDICSQADRNIACFGELLHGRSSSGVELRGTG